MDQFFQSLISKRWLPTMCLALTFIGGMIASLFGFWGTLNISNSIKDELMDTYPTVNQVHQLIDVVQQTQRTLDHYDLIDEEQLNEQLLNFKQAFQRSSLNILRSKQLTESDHRTVAHIETAYLHYLEHCTNFAKQTQQKWDEAQALHEESIQLNLELQNFKHSVIQRYQTNLNQVEQSTRRFSHLFGLLSLVILIIGVFLIAGFLNFIKTVHEQNLTIDSARKEAEKANQGKDDFMAVISHEIRTPMNGVIGMAELLKRSPLNADQQQYVQTILFSAETQLDIIGNILDMSKLQAHKMDLDISDFSLRNTLENIVLQFQGHCEQKKLRLILDVDPHLPLSHRGDQKKISQILNNLLNNAIKFTSEGSILLACHYQKLETGKHQVTLSVTDSGIGIPTDKQDSIFERFTQADSSTTRHYGGTGLGLSICQDLCELMNGSIELTSREGKGSTFTASLPLDCPDESYSPLNTHRSKSLLIATNHRAQAEAISHQCQHWGIATTTIYDLEALFQQLYAKSEFSGLLVDLHLIEHHEASFAQHLQMLPHEPQLFFIGPSEALESKSLIKTFKSFIPIQYPCLVRSIWIEAFRTAWGARFANLILDNEHISPPEHPSHTLDLSKFNEISILMAEDNLTNQVVANEIFSALGFSIDMAEDGQIALEMLEIKKYDMIFMDCLMPELDGYETARAIRKGKLCPELPIIALTANASSNDKKRSLDAGMDEHLTKPLKIEELKACLLRWAPSILEKKTKLEKAEDVSISQEHQNISQKGLSKEASHPIIDESPDPLEPSETPLADSNVDLSAFVTPSASSATPDMNPSNETSADLHFDYQAVLKITGGKENIAQKVIEAFLKSSPKNFEELYRALDENEVSNIHRQAHTLKSSTTYVGASHLAAICIELDRLTKDENQDSLDESQRQHFKSELEASQKATLDDIYKHFPALA